MSELPLSQRPISMEIYQQLELLDRDVYPMPGSYMKRSEFDPRLPGLNSLNTKHSDEIIWYEHLATFRLGKDGPLYVAFRETMDALLARQRDPLRFPEWLMKSKEKRSELTIHVARVLRRPSDKYDRGWLEFLETAGQETLFETISHFLIQQKVVPEDSYVRK